MLVLIFGPIASGLALSYFTKRLPEPLLEAQVQLGTTWLSSRDRPEDRRLVPCITIRNPTKEIWRNLSVGLNEQFYCQEPKGIPAGETVSIPLEAFVARNGSVRFPVGNRDIKLATVFAQIPNGARAVSEHDLAGKSFEPSKSPEKEKAEWIPGARKSDRKSK
jgi:hypothetical protein